jgi:hypothetical protein
MPPERRMTAGLLEVLDMARGEGRVEEIHVLVVPAKAGIP